MKMRPSVLNTFPIACCLMSLVLNGAGKLLILQEPERAIDNTVDGIRYTCISEDDRAALVWNGNLEYYNQKQHVSEETQSTQGRDIIRCALTGPENCTAYWQESAGWEIVNSRDHPTGPVFDSRWEGNCNRLSNEKRFVELCVEPKKAHLEYFAETSFRKDNHDHTNYQYVMEMTESSNVVFSVRGSQDISIRICRNNYTEDGWCSTITLGSDLYKIPNHNNYCMFTDFGKTDEQQCNYMDQTAKSRKMIFSKQLWRTFILKWNFRSIKVCREFQCLFEIPLEQESNLKEKYLFMNIGDKGLMRFHFYDYFLSTRESEMLDSNKFYNNERNLCFKFIAGLCDGCYLEIYLVDVKGKSQWLTDIHRTRFFAVDEMLTWQRVKVNKTLKDDYAGQLSFKVKTRLKVNQSHSQPQWTIGTLRKCKSPDAVRELTFKYVASQILSEGQPVHFCQKMSYSAEESSFVRSYSTIAFNNISASTQEYLRKISYSQAPCPSHWWKRTSICDQSGCVCIEKFSNSPTTVSPNDEESRHGTIFTEPPKLEDVNMRTFSQGNGVVILSLNFPKTFVEKSKSYQLTMELKGTRLRTGRSQNFNLRSRNYTHDPHLMEYNHTLYLLASSEYLFSVHVLDHYGYNKTYSLTYRTTDNIGFEENKKLEVNQTETCIELELPSIVNDTLDSDVITVVKGSSTCASRKLPNMTESEKGWIAASHIFVDQPRSKVIIPIKQRPTAEDTSEDCSLRPGETYVIVVVVVAEKDNATASTASLQIEITVEKNTENSISGWRISLFILAICFLLLFIWRRKLKAAVRQVRLQNLITYSQTLLSFIKLTTEQSATLGETSMNANVSTCERVLAERSSSSTSISIKDFENYVKESIASGLLKSQFVMLQKGLLRPYAYGSLPKNKSKNRYANILPYDDTRVILRNNSGVLHSDYINANYVQGFRKKNAYIAAQGPKPQTVNDFWRMIWQEETLVICMLANVFESRKEKCAQYWPEFGGSRTYGDIVVVTESHQVFADYTFRTFRVSCGVNTRKIEHMHYTGWPDHTVPWYIHPMISYLGKLLTIEIGEGPIVVHCSAGVGRTGTFILCDICLQQAAETGKVDVLTEFQKLRDCRLNMVDNETQYLFGHVVLAECFVSLPTKLSCDNALPQAIEVLKTQLPQHIQRLNDTAWQDQALRSSSMTPMPLIPENVKKNRVPELAPVSNSLVYLKRYPTHDDNSYYINAVIVDGVRVRKQYLASQLPLPSTLADFWRLVAEQEVQHVVVLQRPDPDDPTCCSIIADEPSFNPVPFINVEVKTSRKTGKNFIIDELLLTDESRGVVARTQQVSMLTSTEWGLGKDGKPPPPKNLVDFWIASQNIRREEGPTLVLCHDGITGCGLYLALCFLLERMAVERECDIILAVRAIRRSRPEFVQSQEQFEYLYDAAAKYIEAFQTYANFA